jgi:ATP-binding cassette subfamily B protein
MMVVIALISLRLVAVALIIVPVLILLIKGFRLPLRRGWSRQKDLSNAAMSVINEVFSALRVVKAFTQEEPERDRFTRHATQSFLAQIRVTFLQGSFDLMTGVIIATGTGIVLYVGVTQIQQGLMTTGDLLVVMAYLGLLYGPLQVIGSQVAGMQDSLASAERAFEFLDEQTEVEEKPDALSVQRVNGDFTIKDLSFSYTPDSPVLQHVSIDIPAGTRVGIAGKTGAGKSTFLSLLMRFYDPTTGVITLDGVNLKEYRVNDLRQQFGIVLQEPVLFSTSIADNIAYGRPSSREEEIIAAARAANAHDFIQEFEHGYDTLVGERGMRLSGGERQRIALARAFLRDAPILLLDEPTSSVDLKTEALIMDAMELLMQGRTVFLIAHRLSTLKNCDMIFEVKDRHIEQVERGSFDSFVRVQSGADPDQLTR